MRELPVDVLSVDWRLPLSKVRAVLAADGGEHVLQGNLDPTALLAPIPEIERRVEALIADGSGGGHIANLGHGILPMTPVEHAKAFVEAVQRLSRRPAAA